MPDVRRSTSVAPRESVPWNARDRRDTYRLGIRVDLADLHEPRDTYDRERYIAVASWAGQRRNETDMYGNHSHLYV